MAGELMVSTPVVDKKEQARLDKITARAFKLKMHKDKRGWTVMKGNDKRATEIVIPDTFKGIPIVEIAEKAFYGNRAIDTVVIGNEVRLIGDMAFACCTFLWKLTLGDNVFCIGNAAFNGCSTNFRKLIIPASVRVICTDAFSCCAQLEEVVFMGGEPIQYDSNVFRGCDKLKKVQVNGMAMRFIPKDTVTEAVVANAQTLIGGAFLEAKNLKNVLLAEGLETIEESAFEGCSALESVVMPSTMKTIEKKAFCDCEALETVKLNEGLKTIGQEAFTGCRGLTEMVIPQGVKTMEQGAFLGCEAMKKITLPSTLTKIGRFAFLNCPSLTEITIPASVREIGAHPFGENRCPVMNLCDITAWCGVAFEKAQAAPRTIKVNGELITDLIIPQGVVEIKAFAFSNCNNLLSVTIPAGVASIGDGAFADCKRMTSVKFEGTIKEWLAIVCGSDCFDGVATKEVECSDGKVLL